jgi:hypothetical protein
MKKLAIILMVALYCMISTSCGDEKVKHENSLSGSISYFYHVEIEGKFDGITLLDDGNATINPDIRTVRIEELSKTNVSFLCYYEWETADGGMDVFMIDIPELPINGKPYDVNFDKLSSCIMI